MSFRAAGSSRVAREVVSRARGTYGSTEVLLAMAAHPKKPNARFATLTLLGLVSATACSGDGCSSGCGGITPLPGGFSNEERIENAAAIRITESGFDFLEANVGALAGTLIGTEGGIVEFPIPETSGSQTGIDYTICPGGPDPNANPPRCVAEFDLGNADLSIQPAGPHNIVVAGTIPVRLPQLPFEGALIGFIPCSMDIAMTGNDSCPGENQTFAPVGVSLDISIETDLDPTHARQGYSRVRIGAVDISQNDIENALGFCGGLCASIADLAEGLLVGQLFGGLQDTLVGTVEEQLCQKANDAVDPPCPTGTNNVEGVCRYGTSADDDCVSIVLGMDGHADLGGLLASLSPGTKGGLDFLLAAGGSSQRDDASGYTWGDINPVNNGASLSMFGGVEPSPISGCVPLADLPLPTGLKIPNELLDDQLITDWPAGTPGPHIGIGLSESFFNYAMAGLYNSGLFCIGISTETVDLLNSGTLGLLAQSLKDLGIQQETQPVALMIKPTQPPHVTFGNGTNIETDPLIRLELPQATFDFYMFSSDRYVRFMTATFDLDIPLNLTVTPEGLVPVLETIGIENGKVENAELLKEDGAGIAATLQGLLSSQIGSLLGDGLPAVDLNGALSGLGLRLVIPESVEGQGSPGLRSLTKDGERYLGIFAALEVADAQMMNANAAETQVDVASVEVDPAGLRAGTITPDNAPVITVQAASLSPQGDALEHQVRIDGSLWRPWTRKSTLAISSEALRVEGKHLIEVRSRVVDQPYSLDPTPEELEVIIDTLAPEGRISTLGANGEVNLTVRDMVSREATLVRYRFDDGGYSAWVPAAELPSIPVPETATQVEVEMKDEAGNVGTARQEIIRGLPRGDGGGCGCVVVGSEPSSRGWPLGALGLAMLGALFARRRRAAQAVSQSKRVGGLGAAITRSKPRQAAAAAIVLGVAGSYSGCSCDEETTPPDPDYECVAPGCSTLEPGLIGAYTSADVDADGNVWVAGYLEAAYEQAWPKYGDLVVGRLGEDSKVAWEIIDGVPSDPPPDGKVTNLEGFRGGQTEPGEDVGIWTSLAINPASGLPAVSYYDRTNKALKFAQFNGTAWEIEVVRDEPEGDVGKYSKLVFDGDTAVIAYMFIEPSDSGNIASGVKLARKATGGFQIEEVVRNEATPCRFGLCTGGSQCLADEGTCATTASGCAECAAGEECMQTAGGAACAVVLTSTKVEPYPVASGLYVSLAKVPGGGLGVAYYDRVAGTVNVAAKAAEGWTNVVVDGGVLPSGVVSDVGVGVSLFIDDGGGWHLSYVDGYNEALKYARVKDGVVDALELVDEGFGVDGVPHPDGQHVIGDDSSISVTPSGSVQITYQDATNGTVRFATGTPNASGGNDWSVKVLESEVFGGFFSRQIEIGGSMKVLHWGRQIITTGEGLKKGVGDVAVISP